MLMFETVSVDNRYWWGHLSAEGQWTRYQEILCIFLWPGDVVNASLEVQPDCNEVSSEALKVPKMRLSWYLKFVGVQARNQF